MAWEFSFCRRESGLLSVLAWASLRAAAMAQSYTTRPQYYSLEGIGIFAGLSAKALERIQRSCSWRRYKPKESIVDYLDASDDVFFITAGEARVTIYSQAGKVVSIGELGPGEVFGEYAAVDHCPRSASVEARTSCLIASMPADAFRALLQTEPTVTLAVLTQLVRRARSVTRRVYELSTLHVNTRIQAELLRQASLAHRDGRSARIVPAPKQVEIANRVSTHREAVTREFNRLMRIGIIERRGDSLLVRDVDRLAQIVHDATGE
jgi:CRP/FNR family transcriptional regulator, cyclic AMP receptor protein